MPQKISELDQESGLPVTADIYKIDINSETESIRVGVRLKYLSPTGATVKTSTHEYVRYNNYDVKYAEGDIITAEELEEDDITVKSPAVIATGSEIKEKGNMFFDNLVNSDPGILISKMIQQDLTLIKSISSIETDLKQK